MLASPDCNLLGVFKNFWLVVVLSLINNYMPLCDHQLSCYLSSLYPLCQNSQYSSVRVCYWSPQFPLGSGLADNLPTTAFLTSLQKKSYRMSLCALPLLWGGTYPQLVNPAAYSHDSSHQPSNRLSEGQGENTVSSAREEFLLLGTKRDKYHWQNLTEFRVNPSENVCPDPWIKHFKHH